MGYVALAVEIFFNVDNLIQLEKVSPIQYIGNIV